MVGLKDESLKNLPPGVMGIAKTNNTNELAEIFSAADVFVNPTLEEVLGLVNIEALACGTPVVTFASGGSPECLDDGCGLVVERGDSMGLKMAISTVRETGKEAYSLNCQTRAKVFFDKQTQCQEYLKLYHED
jgi:glycosyltransferase involved in cell wall biosynthesis